MSERHSLSAPIAPVDVVIIGAGVSGLGARSVLKRAGSSVLLFEKSRGSGGRLTSRRGEGWTADLGAQFTSAKQPAWAEIVNAEGVEAVELRLAGDGRYPRFAHREGMSAFARRLLHEFPDSGDVRFQSRVARLEVSAEASSWNVILESGETFSARSMLITAPVPQSIELLQNSGHVLTDECAEATRPLTYTSCLVLLLELAQPLPECVPILWKNPSSALTGIYDQKRKGVRGERSTLVVHASPQKSRELWSQPPEQIVMELQAAVQTALGELGVVMEVTATALHRWRYCEPEQVHSERCLEVQLAHRAFASHPPLVLAGDAFGGASVDGAFSSGEYAGKRLVELLSGVFGQAGSPRVAGGLPS